jgi:hypothetical protein
MSMKVAKWQSQAFASADCRRLSSSRIWPPVSRFSRPSPTELLSSSLLPSEIVRVKPVQAIKVLDVDQQFA